MSNQECKIRPEIVNINSDVFFLIALKQANVVVVVTISTILMLQVMLLMLFKMLTLKCSIKWLY